MHAVIAILAALVRRAATGAGAYLDVAASEGVLSLMSLAVDQYLATGEEPGPRQALLTGRYACYDLYAARDRKWLSVAAIEPHFFANLCRELGLAHHAAHQLDDERQDEIREAFRAAFATRDRDEWVAALAPRDTCVAPVYTISELVDDPHFAARGVFMEAHDAEHGRFRQTGPVLAGGVRGQPAHRVPDPDATESQALLREAGMSPPEIEKLVADGIVE